MRGGEVVERLWICLICCMGMLYVNLLRVQQASRDSEQSQFRALCFNLAYLLLNRFPSLVTPSLLLSIARTPLA